MKTADYYVEIGEKVRERRKKSEYSTEEMEIYREGMKKAYKDVIAMFVTAHTSAQKKTQFIGIFEKEGFSPEELCNFCQLEVNYFADTLSKALKRCLSQEKTLKALSQLTID
jgi:hypothetical protein